MSTNPLQSLGPADNPLRALIFDRVDDAMLVEIAKADYGDDVAVHLAALHQIRAKNIPRPMQWHPVEVLALTNWTEWDETSSLATIFLVDITPIPGNRRKVSV